MDVVLRCAVGPYWRNFLSGGPSETLALTDFLQEKLSFTPNDPKLFQAAFTHGSVGKAADYQRLEFLGDRVLALIITHALYHDFPNEPEGALSVRLNRLVSRQHCAVIARDLDLGPYIMLGKQARDDGARDSTNILGDVVEALIGAIYVDQGFDAASAFVMKYWAQSISQDGAASKHPKSLLQEWAASNRHKMPEYTMLERSGPHHALQFKIQVNVPNVGSVEASGPSKQHAETAAARAFLDQFNKDT